MKNYYKILEIDFGTDISTIKKSFRRLALKYHPDKNKNPNAIQKFIEITEAYEVLFNDIKRAQYDELYKTFFKFKEQDNKPDKNVMAEKTQDWSNYGKMRAEEYASMKYDDFAERIIDELRLGISYTPNLIFILFCGVGVITSFFIMAKVSGILGLAMLLIYGTLCYFLFERAKQDYIAERKHKILTKYK
jgi:curved DNA-binding protein CbpA